MRNTLLILILGLPALLLLVLGPRGAVNIPPDRTVVRYWEKWTGVEALAMQEIVDEFNRTVGAAEHIWVDYNAVSNVDQRLKIATAGGDPPDVAGLYDYAVPQFAEFGALTPLDDLVAKSAAIDPNVFKPIWIEICTHDAQLYALPSAPYTIALYYNRRLFRAAGLDPNQPPRTIAELDAYSRALTRRGPDGKITQLGFTVSPKMLGWWHWVWPCFFGAEMWDGEAFHLDTPAGRAAYEWIHARRAEYGFDDITTFESGAGAIEGAQNPFLSEQIAMVFQGPWIANWVRQYTPDLDYGVAPFPSSDADAQYVFASTDVFVIPTNAPHEREALIFLEYVLQPEVLERLCRAHYKMSPFRTPGPDFYALHENPHVRTFDQMAGSPDAFGYPAMPTWPQATDELKELLELVLTGEPVAPAVAATQRRIDRIVAQQQHMAARRAAARED